MAPNDESSLDDYAPSPSVKYNYKITLVRPPATNRSDFEPQPLKILGGTSDPPSDQNKSPARSYQATFLRVTICGAAASLVASSSKGWKPFWRRNEGSSTFSCTNPRRIDWNLVSPHEIQRMEMEINDPAFQAYTVPDTFESTTNQKLKTKLSDVNANPIVLRDVGDIRLKDALHTTLHHSSGDTSPLTPTHCRSRRIVSLNARETSDGIVDSYNLQGGS
ncbi:hypothetical protein I302_107010 [Kwoniella bestiolae CBS 10118]|uniref:Uncharacterized protein n=1 Tax=Kwoniella bestiolae CBS 10118 TaxID=1296100 RepID=A0A1B9FZR7_9TREE|nr:hypothetical protein I302_05727 [Kwoniella bestiolae CBS 10118]OCF24268.1 hypothetical protein I302_05727 [Kwoniella bestiolae CBS 10118]